MWVYHYCPYVFKTWDFHTSYSGLLLRRGGGREIKRDKKGGEKIQRGGGGARYRGWGVGYRGEGGRERILCHLHPLPSHHFHHQAHHLRCFPACCGCLLVLALASKLRVDRLVSTMCCFSSSSLPFGILMSTFPNIDEVTPNVKIIVVVVVFFQELLNPSI